MNNINTMMSKIIGMNAFKAQHTQMMNSLKLSMNANNIQNTLNTFVAKHNAMMQQMKAQMNTQMMNANANIMNMMQNNMNTNFGNLKISGTTTTETKIKTWGHQGNGNTVTVSKNTKGFTTALKHMIDINNLMGQINGMNAFKTQHTNMMNNLKAQMNANNFMSIINQFNAQHNAMMNQMRAQMNQNMMNMN